MAPDGSLVRVLLDLPGGGLAQFTLPPGQTSQAVYHRTVEEIWFIVSGQGEMWRRLGKHDETVPLHAGVCLTIPVGTRFQFRSLGTDALTVVGVTMPPWPGDGEAVGCQGPWGPTLAPGPGLAEPDPGARRNTRNDVPRPGCRVQGKRLRSVEGTLRPGTTGRRDRSSLRGGISARQWSNSAFPGDRGSELSVPTYDVRANAGQPWPARSIGGGRRCTPRTRSASRAGQRHAVFRGHGVAPRQRDALATMGFLAYLEPLTTRTGALRVMPGSHACLSVPLPTSFEGGPAGPGQAIDTQPGDVVAFDEHLVHGSHGGTERRQWRADFVVDPKSAAEEAQVKAYFGHIFPDRQGQAPYDATRYPSYGPYWQSLDRPWTARLLELGVYRRAEAAEGRPAHPGPAVPGSNAARLDQGTAKPW